MLKWLTRKYWRSKPPKKSARRRANADQLALALSQMTGGAYYPVHPMSGGTIQARYDLAQTTDGNRKHWGAADALSADAANSLSIRRILRNRTRYEVANNSYVKGIVSTLANDTIGTGPRLQMLGLNHRSSSRVEADFASWAKETKLAKKLRQMRRARMESGESFLVVFFNPKLKHPVKLDLMVVESDRVTDVAFEFNTDPLWCDGIKYDEYGNAVSYRVLKYHPGATNAWFTNPTDYIDYPAEFVYHDFKDDERPGARRGVPELTPSVQTGGELRRYDNAVLRTAEVHARLALALQVDVSPEVEASEADPELPENMDTVELPDSGAIVLPPGYKLNGIDSKQPTDTHRDFVDIKLRETARCVNMPFTIAAMDSSKSNLSARYLDSQIYAAAIKVDRHDIASECCDWLFNHWVHEYWLVKPNVPRGTDRYPHTWYWPSMNQHADPSKVAKAQKDRVETGSTSLSDEIAENGEDWEETFEKEARVLGVTVQQYQKLLRLNRFGTADPEGLVLPAPPQPEVPEGETDDEESRGDSEE